MSVTDPTAVVDPKTVFAAPSPDGIPDAVLDDEDDEHGEIYEALEALMRDVRRRHKNFGGLELEEGDDGDKIKRAADRFLGLFTKDLSKDSKPEQVGAAVGRVMRDELRDNGYAHLRTAVDLMLDIAVENEDLADEVEDIKEILMHHKQEIERLSLGLQDVVIKQLVALSRTLASAVLADRPKPEQVYLAQTILDVHQATPAVAATDEAAESPVPPSVPVQTVSP